VKSKPSLRIGVLLAAALPVAQAAVANDPVTLRPGDARVDGLVLKPYRNAWRFTYRKPGAKAVDMGLWTDDLRETRWRGRRVMVRTQEARYNKRGVRTTTVNVFDPKTLAPLAMDWKLDEGNFNHREFEGAQVRFRRLTTPPGGVLQEGTATLEAAPFDFLGGMYGLVAVALPLRPGFTAKIPSIDEREEVLRWVDLTVRGKGRVAAGRNRTVSAWLVEARTPDGPMTFWLTKDPPYVIKLVFNAAGGVVWTYDMV
jgi:hypothetical protein